MQFRQLTRAIATMACLSNAACHLAGHRSGSGGSSFSEASNIAVLAARSASPNVAASPSTTLSTNSTVRAREFDYGNEQPWEKGIGLRLAPGFVVGGGGTTVHPTLGYTYLSFEGGNDQLLELGGQVRRQLTPGAKGVAGFWFGGEVAVARLRTAIDDVPSISTNGWALTALAGFPLGDNKWGLNLYGGAGISHYGVQGVNLRAGIDLQPWFLDR
jgi:hypothetical protein